MKFICICSGISSPTQAWKPLGFEPIAYAEFDPFAAAVLSLRCGAGRPMHMPDPEEPGIKPEIARARANAIKTLDGWSWGNMVPNYGDFTRLRDERFIGEADILIGGTPCQDFSLAGLRASLSGHRGNLTMEFIHLANAVEDIRRADGKPPVFIWWENVTGILSTGDNAFGAFLAGMVGSESPIAPPVGKSWTDAGLVSGPRRLAAWRVLDAQHFGLAQRRRRVLVFSCEHSGAAGLADSFLPIIDSLRGHFAPRAEAEEGVARSLGASLGGPSAKEQQLTFIAGDRPLNALPRGEDSSAGSVGGSGEGAGGSDRGGGSGAVLGERLAFGGRFSGPIEVSPTLLAHQGSGVRMDLESDAFVLEPPIAFSAKDFGQDAGEISPTLRAMGHDKSHANAGGQIAVAFSMRGRDGENMAEAESGGVSPALRTGGGDSSKPFVAISDPAPMSSMVRRLTLVECERLQGFEDNFTLIPWSDARRDPQDLAETAAYLESHGFEPEEALKLASTPDGPRYRVLGNSMAKDMIEYLGKVTLKAAALRDERRG